MFSGKVSLQYEPLLDLHSDILTFWGKAFISKAANTGLILKRTWLLSFRIDTDMLQFTDIEDRAGTTWKQKV